jgi:hypothetical protein
MRTLRVTVVRAVKQRDFEPGPKAFEETTNQVTETR